MANGQTYSIPDFATIVTAKYPDYKGETDSATVNNYLLDYPDDREFLAADIGGEFARPGKEMSAGFGKRALFNAKSQIVGMDDTAVGFFSQLQPPKQFYSPDVERDLAKWQRDKKESDREAIQALSTLKEKKALQKVHQEEFIEERNRRYAEKFPEETIERQAIDAINEKRKEFTEKYSNMAADMVKASNKKIESWIADDIEIQAYLNWKADEPITVENFLKHPASLFGRALSEALPSLVMMAGSYGVGSVIGIGGAVASIGTMTAMETSSEFGESMNFYMEKGFDNQKAVEMSTLSASLYGPVSGVLENLPLFRVLKRTGLSKVGANLLRGKIDDVVLKSVLKSGGVKTLWGKMANGTGVALETSLTEGVEEWTQLMAQRIIQESVREGYGVTPDEALQSVWDIVRNEPGQFETFFTGAVGGIAFGGALSGVGAAKKAFDKRKTRIVDKKYQKAKDELRKEGTTETFEPPIEVDAPIQPGEEETPTSYLKDIIRFGVTGDIVSQFNINKVEKDSELSKLVQSHRAKGGKVASLEVGKKVKDVIETFGKEALDGLSTKEKDYIDTILGLYVSKNKTLAKAIENEPELIENLVEHIAEGDIEFKEVAGEASLQGVSEDIGFEVTVTDKVLANEIVDAVKETVETPKEFAEVMEEIDFSPEVEEVMEEVVEEEPQIVEKEIAKEKKGVQESAPVEEVEKLKAEKILRKIESNGGVYHFSIEGKLPNKLTGKGLYAADEIVADTITSGFLETKDNLNIAVLEGLSPQEFSGSQYDTRQKIKIEGLKPDHIDIDTYESERSIFIKPEVILKKIRPGVYEVQKGAEKVQGEVKIDVYESVTEKESTITKKQKPIKLYRGSEKESPIYEDSEKRGVYGFTNKKDAKRFGDTQFEFNYTPKKVLVTNSQISGISYLIGDVELIDRKTDKVTNEAKELFPDLTEKEIELASEVFGPQEIYGEFPAIDYAVDKMFASLAKRAGYDAAKFTSVPTAKEYEKARGTNIDEPEQYVIFPENIKDIEVFEVKKPSSDVKLAPTQLKAIDEELQAVEFEEVDELEPIPEVNEFGLTSEEVIEAETKFNLETTGKTEPIRSDIKTVGEGVRKVASETFKGLSEKFKDEYGFIRVGKSEEEVYSTASEHFEEAWDTAKKTYKLGSNEFKSVFVPAMMGYIDKIRSYNKALAGALKKLFLRWARESHSQDFVDAEPEIAPIIKSKAKVIGKLSNKIAMAKVGRRLENLRLWDGILDEGLAPESGDNAREGLGVYHASDSREVSRNMRTDSFNLSNAVFYSFIGDFVSNSDAKDIEHAVRTMKTEQFADFIHNRFGAVASTTMEKNQMSYYWTRNQKINKQNRNTYIEYMYANIDENGNQIRNFKNKNIVLKEGKDIRTGKDIPDFAPVSFADYDFLTGKNSRQTGRLRLSDIITVKTAREPDADGNPVYYGVPANVELSAKTLLDWDVAHSDMDNPVVIAGLKGGTKASILFTPVTKEDIKLAKEGKWLGEKYWSKELKDGHILESHIKDVQKSATLLAKAGSKLPMAQMIARHEWVKSKMHNDYIFDGSVQDIFKRLNLAFSEGVVAIGSGESAIRLFNPRKVELRHNGKTVEMVGEYGGIKDKYRFDGSLFVSGAYLKKQEKGLGRIKTSKVGKGLDENKTVTRHKSDDGNDHLNLKGMEMVPDVNLEWIDKETGTVIAKTVEQSGLVNIIDENGHQIDKLATLDEAKNVNGVFRLHSREHDIKKFDKAYTDVINIPEEATRSIIVPSEFSKKSASFVNQWLDILTHPDFGDVRSSMTKHMVNTVNSYIQRLFDMRSNPEMFEKYVKAVVTEGTSLPNRVSQLIVPDGENYIKDGYLMPDISSILLNNISNRMIVDGAFKGRREGEGSYLNMKPDMTDTVKKGTVHVSAKNTTILKKLRKLSGLKSVEDINEWLKSNPKGAWVLISRFPINDVPSVGMLRITNLREGQHGDSIFFHPDYVYDQLKADHDGDHTFLEFFNEELTAKLRAIKKKVAFKEKQKTVNLVNYKHLETNNSYLDAGQFYKMADNIIQSVNSQGIVTNIKSLRGVLLTKGFNITVDGVKITPTAEVIKSDNDLVVQDYAPLIPEATLNEGDKFVTKTGKKWNSGVKYLMTSSEHELSVLMQAATDNTKEMLLGMWVANSKFDNIRDFMLSRIFKREDGKALTQEQVNVLSLVADYYSYSAIRQGKNQYNVRQSMEGIFNESNRIATRIKDTKENQQSELKNYITGLSSKDTYGKEQKIYGVTQNVVLNGKPSPIELVLSELDNVREKYMEKNPNDVVVGHPFGYTVRREENARFTTVSQLFRQANKYHITDSDAKKGLKLATEMMTEYGNIFKKRLEFKRNPKNKYKVMAGSFDTNEAINDFVTKWTKKFKESGIDITDMKVRKSDSVLAAITLFSIRGVAKLESSPDGMSIKWGRVRDVEHLPPPELLSIPIYEDYANMYGKQLRTINEKGINLAHTDPVMEIKLEC